MRVIQVLNLLFKIWTFFTNINKTNRTENLSFLHTKVLLLTFHCCISTEGREFFEVLFLINKILILLFPEHPWNKELRPILILLIKNHNREEQYHQSNSHLNGVIFNLNQIIREGSQKIKNEKFRGCEVNDVKVTKLSSCGVKDVMTDLRE